MTDEAELLQRLRNREKNSIDEAIRIYTPYLSTVLYHMTGNSLPKEDIEEIVADVFVVLWKNAGRIDLQKGTLRSYLAAVARNFALKRINRKEKRIIHFLKILNCQMAKISWKRIFTIIMYGKQL